MTELGEPTLRNNGDFNFGLQKAILAEALGAFSANVLANDMLFRAISAKLREDETGNDGEPDIRTDFSVAPNMENNEYSLCLGQSARVNMGNVGPMFIGVEMMEYVPVCSIKTDKTGKRSIVVDQHFVELALGRDVATEEPTQEEVTALGTAARTVLLGVNEIDEYCTERGVKLVFGLLGRLQLVEEAERTAYFSG